ncbi:unnamed protein product [Toxocara canis]|uniref:GATOR complex protein NPRL3 n=1 Tax=Toxocara canis TaxID=6265 RepID=A0A183UU90_TOXCA|nr:unnamed protein product [Toxocara canis]
MDEERYLYAPLGLMFVTMGDNHEQVSFSYPFSYDHIPVRSDTERSSSPERITHATAVPTAILAHLLSAKGMCDAPFEIKIDNFRFAGFPKTVSNPIGRSPQIFHVVFVLVANAPAHLVNSFQTLSGKLALAIDEEQSRCGYLADQMTTMLNEHDKNESLPNADESFPYREILEQSSLAQELRDVFEDVSDYGMVHVFINDCVEIGFCIETRAHLRAGLTPKSR